MEDNVEKMNLAFKQIFEFFKPENLKDSQRETLQNQVKGQDVFISQSTGPIMQDQVWYLRSVGIKAKFNGDEQESRGQSTGGTWGLQNCVWLTRGIFIYQKMLGNAQQ
ncbi:unnamed protein product [Porites evermanni]|uniref:Uncharacterized protein n=1 Tax=Porites evermanni TaxID=104178 RepID=A0ABN8SXN2_9CNID|nr:unnamed protein product [Porites evermanni]